MKLLLPLLLLCAAAWGQVGGTGQSGVTQDLCYAWPGWNSTCHKIPYNPVGLCGVERDCPSREFPFGHDYTMEGVKCFYATGDPLDCMEFAKRISELTSAELEPRFESALQKQDAVISALRSEIEIRKKIEASYERETAILRKRGDDMVIAIQKIQASLKGGKP